MNMIASTAALTAPIISLEKDNVAIAEAGLRFEGLFIENFDNAIAWARAHREARAAFKEEHGHYHEQSSPADYEVMESILDAIFAKNGTDLLSARSDALYEAMAPLADEIKTAPGLTIRCLRWKTLVALWEALPSCAYNDGQLNFFSEYDGGALRSMFEAAVSLLACDLYLMAFKRPSLPTHALIPWMKRRCGSSSGGQLTLFSLPLSSKSSHINET
jgi:hypothetical protein